MLKFFSRVATPIVVLAAASVPSTANARILLDRAAPEAAVVAVQPAAQTDSAGEFAWGDAAIGAGATLLVVGAGASAGVAGRRRRTSRAAVA